MWCSSHVHEASKESWLVHEQEETFECKIGSQTLQKKCNKFSGWTPTQYCWSNQTIEDIRNCGCEVACLCECLQLHTPWIIFTDTNLCHLRLQQIVWMLHVHMVKPYLNFLWLWLASSSILSTAKGIRPGCMSVPCKFIVGCKFDEIWRVCIFFNYMRISLGTWHLGLMILYSN